MNSNHRTVRRSPQPPGRIRHGWTENGYITAWHGPIFPETDCSTERTALATSRQEPGVDILQTVLDGLRRL